MDKTHRIRKLMLACASALALTLLVNCGGGGSSSGGSGLSVSGIAATGAPINGATVTLTDATGKTQTTTTAADGSYSINVAGLTPPFLIAISSGGVTLYSYAVQAGATANVNPYTSLVLTSLYAAQGSTPAAEFAAPSPSTLPGTQQLTLVETPISNVLQVYLSAAGVTSPSTFNVFTTSFAANGAGFDAVLDKTTLNPNQLGFTVSNSGGTVSSTVAIATTAGNGTNPAQVTVTTSTTDTSSSNTSTSQQTALVGSSSSQQSDLVNAENGVLDLFNSLYQLELSHPGTLTASQVSPYVNGNYLTQGTNAPTMAQNIADAFNSFTSGDTVAFSIYNVSSFTDGTSPQISVVVKIVVTPSGGGAPIINYLDNGHDNANDGVIYQQPGGSGTWQFYGDNTAYNAQVSLQQTLFYNASNNSSSSTLDMFTQVSVPTGSLSGVSVSGPANSLPDCSQNPSPLTQSSVTLTLDAGLVNGGDRYDLPCNTTNAGAISSAPAAGTTYVFALTPSSGPVVHQSDNVNAATTDNGDITLFNSTARATFATNTASTSLAGTTVTISYTEPTTYSLLYAYLTGYCQNASEVINGGGSDFNGNLGSIPPGTDSGTIDVPAMCDGAATASVTLSVGFVGVNGERSQVQQIFN